VSHPPVLDDKALADLEWRNGNDEPGITPYWIGLLLAEVRRLRAREAARNPSPSNVWVLRHVRAGYLRAFGTERAVLEFIGALAKDPMSATEDRIFEISCVRVEDKAG
jgi:hypothetical protein